MIDDQGHGTLLDRSSHDSGRSEKSTHRDDDNVARMLFVGLLVSIILSCIDPFGIQQVSADRSDAVVRSTTQFIRALYAQDPSESVVILYDEEQYSKKGWPIPTSDLVEFFRIVGDANAKALFVDIEFSIPRDDPHYPLCQIAEAVAILQHGGQRRISDNRERFVRDIYRTDESVGDEYACADVLDGTAVQAGQINGFATRSTKWRRGSVAVNRANRIKKMGGVPVLLAAPMDYLDSRETLRQETRARFLILDRASILVPYETMLQNGDGYAEEVFGHDDGSGPGCLPEYPCRPRFPSPAYLLAMVSGDEPSDGYGMTDNPFFLDVKWSTVGGDKSVPQCSEGLTRVQRVVANLLFGPMSGSRLSKPALEARCPPVTTVKFSELLANPKLHTMLSGKVVMLGADVRVLGDYIKPAGRPDTAGVYLHAMAYQNYISGHRSQAASPHVRSLSFLTQILVNIMYSVALIFIIKSPFIDLEMRERQKDSFPARHIRTTGETLLFGALVSGVLAYAMVRGMDQVKLGYYGPPPSQEWGAFFTLSALSLVMTVYGIRLFVYRFQGAGYTDQQINPARLVMELLALVVIGWLAVLIFSEAPAPHSEAGWRSVVRNSMRAMMLLWFVLRMISMLIAITQPQESLVSDAGPLKTSYVLKHGRHPINIVSLFILGCVLTLILRSIASVSVDFLTLGLLVIVVYSSAIRYDQVNKET